MNIFDATTKATPRGYIGLFRCVHKADYHEVCERGHTRYFKDQKDAHLAAFKALFNHLNTDLTGFGERVSRSNSIKAKADKLFMGGGKVIPVEIAPSQRAIMRDIEERRERIARKMEQR